MNNHITNSVLLLSRYMVSVIPNSPRKDYSIFLYVYERF